MQQTRHFFHATWPLLCFIRGLVVVMLMAVTLVMFNRMGMSNTAAAIVTSLFLLPMALRPFLSIVVESAGKPKWWMVIALAVFAGALFMAAGHLDAFPDEWQMWLAMAVAALAGAFFDAAANESRQEALLQKNYGMLKIMVPCKLMAVVIVMGVVLLLAGNMEVMSRDITESWALALKVAAFVVVVMMLLLWATVPNSSGKATLGEAWQQRRGEMAEWWKADRLRWLFVCFVILFPLHEFFLWKGTLLFLVDKGSIGGLSFSPQEVGFAFCTVATLMAIAGYVMGVNVIRKYSLKKWWWVMALAFTIPDAVYVYLAYAMPDELWLVTLCLSVEQWCCGFGIAAYIIYIMYGNHKKCSVTHLDICWSLVVISMVLSGCVMGVMKDYLGYRRFFIVVMVLAILALAIAGWMAKKAKTNTTDD